MDSFPSSLSYVERLFLADRNGALMADAPPLPGTREKDFSYRDWYRGVTKTGTPYVSEIYKRAAAPQINVIAVAVPIKNRKQGLLGILAMQVRLEVFFDWFKDAASQPTWLIYIVDRNGQTAFHPKYTPHGETVNFSQVPAVQQALHVNRADRAPTRRRVWARATWDWTVYSQRGR